MRVLQNAALALATMWIVVVSQEDQDGEEPPMVEHGEEPPISEEERDPLTSEQIRTVHSAVDKNGDGRISLAEVMEHSDKIKKLMAQKDTHELLKEMDTDNDGKLSLTELMKDLEPMPEDDPENLEATKKYKDLETAKFEIADENGDGFLQVHELSSYFYPDTNPGILELLAKTTLKERDLDGDGKLSFQEFSEDTTAQEDSGENHFEFQQFDKDGDGKLNLEELKVSESGRHHTEKTMQSLIEIADQDNDGHVTREELDAAKEMLVTTDAHYELVEWAKHDDL